MFVPYAWSLLVRFTCLEILAGPDGTITVVDHLLVDEQFRAGSESVMGRQRFHSRQHGSNILHNPKKPTINKLKLIVRRNEEMIAYAGPHVFGCIQADAGHADVDQLIEVAADDIADVVRSPVQIRQPVEEAVAHVAGNVVVTHLTVT